MADLDMARSGEAPDWLVVLNVGIAKRDVIFRSSEEGRWNSAQMALLVRNWIFRGETMRSGFALCDTNSVWVKKKTY